MENKSYEIDSAHWYHSDDNNAQTADDAAVEYFDSGLQYKKPVVLTESGNAAHNWDPVSHLRMRIRSWVSFFKGVTLMWWNTAGTQSCRPCGGLTLSIHRRRVERCALCRCARRGRNGN